MEIDKLKVTPGIKESQISELIYYANTDPQVREFTSDPTRFSDRDAFEKWKAEGRTVYTLTDESNELFGIVWFGAKVMPKKGFTTDINPDEYGITFAVRTYGEARGKGLSVGFIQKAVDMYRSSPEFKVIKNQGIWLETHNNNLAAVNSYKKFGFKQVSNPDEGGRLLMVLDNI